MNKYQRDYEKLSVVENVSKWAAEHGFSGRQFSKLRKSLRVRAIRRGFDSDYVRVLQREAISDPMRFAK